MASRMHLGHETRAGIGFRAAHFHEIWRAFLRDRHACRGCSSENDANLTLHRRVPPPKPWQLWKRFRH